ncbi:MAG TPA: M14 family metallopeptidase [Pyrinomonadaceae bacterium]|nr:M14 family metallopeptidase [Pyrinomonadaceae bacterium]
MLRFVKSLFFSSIVSITLILTPKTMAQNNQKTVPPEWQTYAEKTDYRETPRYDETIAYSRRLDEASPLIRLTSFGESGEGRSLPLLIAAQGEAFTPAEARRAGKAIILVQACIHPGEPDGKDAGLALLRDIAITREHPNLLDHVVLLFIPIYNTDGHERFSPYNRINQNGPAEMGWRGTATNLNLNRDYMKADAPETRAWLRLWTEWNPDLFIDCHVTDGADYRYNITYQYEHHGNVPAPVLAWERAAFDERIVPATEAAGNLLSTYLEFRDNRDFSKGIDSFIAPPRFSTGYTPVRNRPGLLIETHMFKDYRSRVRGTYDLLRFALEEVNRDREALLGAVRQADEQAIAEGQKYDPSRTYPLRFELTDKATPFKLKAVESHTELSDVSGAMRVVFGTKPVDLTVPLYDEVRVTEAATTPLYYVVPPQWKDVIAVLAAHGLRLQRLAAPATLEVESYRFSDAKWAPAPFEGRVMPTFKTNPVREKRLFPAGSVVVPLAQPAAHVIMHLLEPQAPDSFVAWGFFNAIFEQKEYGEDYILEKLAREMLEKDENLRREFGRRVVSDPQFAASPGARLRFFYERSPYWDQQLNLYPVGRIVSPPDVKLADF